MQTTPDKSWFDRLNQPVDGAALAVFRIVFGAMVAFDALRYLHEGWVDEYFVRPATQFTYLYLDFVRPLPPPWIHAHFYFIAGAGVLVSIGLFYRAATVGLFASYAYFFLLEQATYMNHYYLITLVAFLLSWMPAHRVFSIDSLRASTYSDAVPQWCVWLLRFQLFVVYFYGAIAKLNGDWLRGEPMYTQLVQQGPDIPEIATHFPPALLAYAIAYSGLIVDAAIPILLVRRRTRWAGYALAFSFHLLNAVFLNIGIFSYLMVGAITIFFDPDWPRRLWRRIRSTPVPVGLGLTAPKTSAAVLLMLHAYVAFQLLFPFRHALFPGNVSWTEEGHRFAWQMKLRRKESDVTITARDPATGAEWTVDPTKDLVYRQVRKLSTFPDIMLQYAHYNRDKLRAAGIANPEIRVLWKCSLNGAPPSLLVDPDVDLAKVERTWRPAEWILRQGERPATASALRHQPFSRLAP